MSSNTGQRKLAASKTDRGHLGVALSCSARLTTPAIRFYTTLAAANTTRLCSASHLTNNLEMPFHPAVYGSQGLYTMTVSVLSEAGLSI